MFQSSFELTGYITTEVIRAKEEEKESFKALSSLRVI